MTPMCRMLFGLLESGKNVISTAGFHWPQAHGRRLLSRIGLRDLPPLKAVTLAGEKVGVNPVLLPTPSAQNGNGDVVEIDELRLFETVDASPWPAETYTFLTDG